jgi:glycine oxidase
LVLATGHFRNGILLAPITAQAIAEVVVSNRVADEIIPFKAGRFSVNSG